MAEKSGGYYQDARKKSQKSDVKKNALRSLESPTGEACIFKCTLNISLDGGSIVFLIWETQIALRSENSSLNCKDVLITTKHTLLLPLCMLSSLLIFDFDYDGL